MTPRPVMIRTSRLADLRRRVAAWRKAGQEVAFVPTMGALHVGHRRLIEAAGGPGRRVVVSLFVNPIQFGPKEDFAAYPRPMAADLALCREAGAHLVFAPPTRAVFPEGFRTRVHVADLDRVLCGPHRPGHFDGVTTIVLKLLNMVQPDRLLLGQKDAQQAVIVGSMIRDLDLPVRLQILPTVREPDGLACSSRNRYLTPAERRVAPLLYVALRDARDRIRGGERSGAVIRAAVSARIGAEPAFRLQYADVVDAGTLDPLETLSGRVLVAVAAFLGKARLIDNIVANAPRPGRKGSR